MRASPGTIVNESKSYVISGFIGPSCRKKDSDSVTGTTDILQEQMIMEVERAQCLNLPDNDTAQIQANNRIYISTEKV